MDTELTKAQAAGCSTVTGFDSSVADSQAAEVAMFLKLRTNPGTSARDQIGCEAYPKG